MVMRGPGRSLIRAASHTVGIVARLRLVAGGTGAGFGIGQGQMRLPGVDRVEFELGDLRCLGTVAQRFAHRSLEVAFDEPVEELAGRMRATGAGARSLGARWLSLSGAAFAGERR